MNQYMKLAKKEAQKGTSCNHGGPFGCIIVKDEKVIASSHNEVLKRKDPTAHAEILAIQKACRILKTQDLKECTLYTTCEPCPMCLSAIIWANIKNVYYACNRTDADKIGFKDDFIYEYLKGKKQIDLSLIPLDRESCISDFLNYEGDLY